MSDSPTSIELVVNGRERRVAAGATVGALVDEMGCDPRTVAVERNGAIVRRTEYPSTRLEAGDRLEVVRFVQGG